MLKEILRNQSLVTCEPDAKVSEVSRLMADRNVGSVLCLSDDGKPRGILTDRDIVVRCLAKNIDVNDCTVENVMSESLEVCQDTDGVFDCIRKMEMAGVRRIPVIDDSGKAVGIISFGDLLKMLSKEFSTLIHHTTTAEYEDRGDEEERRMVA
ncbi:MAG: CBS domain-containing protein [Oligoflexia bacterium]|nr:CBS domain-containing protein [Oligoflexia bacterium]